MAPRPSADDTFDAKSSKSASTYVQTGIWALTVVFSAGVFYSSTASSNERVRKLEADLASHLVHEGHPLTTEKVRSLSETTHKIEQSFDSLDATVRRIDKNMIAVCTVVRGAQCSDSGR